MPAKCPMTTRKPAEADFARPRIHHGRAASQNRFQGAIGSGSPVRRIAECPGRGRNCVGERGNNRDERVAKVGLGTAWLMKYKPGISGEQAWLGQPSRARSDIDLTDASCSLLLSTTLCSLLLFYNSTVLPSLPATSGNAGGPCIRPHYSRPPEYSVEPSGCSPTSHTR